MPDVNIPKPLDFEKVSADAMSVNLSFHKFPLPCLNLIPQTEHPEKNNKH